MKLLLCEDEKELSNALKAILRHNNYTVDAVYDGEDALAYAEADQYDGIILDLMMPKMNGDEAARCIRKINPSIPIVAMRAQSEYSMNQMIMNDSISKPIDEQKLNHILSKYVS